MAKPLVDALLTVNVMLTKEALKGAAPSHLGGFERRPLTEKVAKELRLLLGEPLEHLRKRGLSCAGQAIGDSDAVRPQPSTVYNQLREGAPLWTLGRQWLALIPVPQSEVELQFGIGWIVLRPARGKSFTISRQHHGIDVKEHQPLIFA